jgi:hypothetical protein
MNMSNSVISILSESVIKKNEVRVPLMKVHAKLDFGSGFDAWKYWILL